MAACTELDNLRAWLKQYAPENVLMPLVQKRPWACHRGESWTWADYDRQHPVVQVGILMVSLFCLDIDSPDLYDYLVQEHPEWFAAGVILAKTSNGYHAIWARNELCDEYELTDKARALDPSCVPEQFLDTRGQVPIDVKTVTSTGTAGVLVVALSSGKAWITPPWSFEAPPPVPGNLLEWLEENKKRSIRRRCTPSQRAADQAASGVPDISNPRYSEALWTLPIDVQQATETVYLALHEHGDYASKFYWQQNNSLYFLTGTSRHCPYGDVHCNNNFCLNFTRHGQIEYFCFGSDCQGKYASRPESIGRWFEHELEADKSRFNFKYFKAYSSIWEQEMQLKPRDRDEEQLTDLKERLLPYLNTFFVVVASKTPEILELHYDGEGEEVVNLTRRSLRMHWLLFEDKFMRKVWFGGGDRRTVDRLVFEVDPARVTAREFNLFLGLRVHHDFDVEATQLDESRISLILELLRDVWADGDEDVYNYILNWMAYPLQKKRKTEVCIVVISDQGYGKGTIAHDLLGVAIYGEVTKDQSDGCYTQITDIDDVVGRFNTLSCNRLFINADECSSFSGAYRMNNRFKNLITSRTRKLEAKGLDAVIVSDHTNYLMTTNDSHPVKVEPTDRRLVVLEINHSREKSAEFFAAVHECIQSDGPLHFYKYLMGRDLSQFHPRFNRPVTSAARSMMAEQVAPHIRFIQDCAKNQIVPDFPEDRVWTAEIRMPAQDLYMAFQKWAQDRKVERFTNDVHFSRDLKKYAGIDNDDRDNRGSILLLPPPDFVIRSLKACKRYYNL